jgi:hypothetical protein
MLLGAGADTRVKDSHGASLVAVAKKYEDSKTKKEVLKLLKKFGAKE